MIMTNFFQVQTHRRAEDVAFARLTGWLGSGTAFQGWVIVITIIIDITIDNIIDNIIVIDIDIINITIDNIIVIDIDIINIIIDIIIITNFISIMLLGSGIACQGWVIIVIII